MAAESSADVAATAQSPEPLEPAIEYVGPDTFILLDKEGRPQPVLGMSYEEFVAAWKRLHQAEPRDAKPRYSIEDLQAVGKTRGDQAVLDITVTIRVESPGRVRVPLGMTEAILAEEPRVERLNAATAAADAPDAYVSYDGTAGGYVAWINGQPQELRISLKLLRPLTRTGNETNVALNLPRALVSRFALEVPERVTAATASEGVVTMSVATAEATATRLKVTGPRGDFRLSWTAAANERPELATVISATGAIGISIDGHSVRTDAVLTVRSFGGGFDRVQVRLPPGAQLIDEAAESPEAESAKYRVLVEDRLPGGADGGLLATVQFDEKQTRPVEIRLSTEQPLGLTGEEAAIQLAGFEVVGAVRQFGDVAVTVADDWQFRWENGPYVRQVERTELAESLRGTPPTAAFQYDRQPWSLRAEIVPRPMVVQVTPAYEMKIGLDEAELRARLQYQVPGARAFEFRVQLHGWELTPDPIESNGLVDRDRAIVTRDGVLALPLSQASSRRAEIEFSLRRSIPLDATRLALPLPAPEADATAPSNVTIVADPAIELLPDLVASRGLAPVPVGNERPAATSEEVGERFLYRTFGENPQFVAQRTLRPRDVATELRTDLSLFGQRARVRQEYLFHVRYQPLSELAFRLPMGWKLTGDRVQIVPVEASDEPILAAVAIEPQTHGRPHQIGRAQLAQPRLGQFRVSAEFECDRTAGVDQAEEELFELPLAEGTRLTTHQVEVTPSAELSVSVDPSLQTAWHRVATDNASAKLALIGNGATGGLPLVVSPLPAARAPNTRVEKVWLQTWQAGNVIQDRAAIHFRTGDSKVIVELPPSATAADVEVVLDGELADTQVEQEGRLAVLLHRTASDVNASPASHTLELRYRRPAPTGLVPRFGATPPQLVGSSGLCDVIWQVVLPGDRHLVSSPANLAKIESIPWMEIIFGHAAGKSQAELEEWASATSQPAPSATQNSYTYAGLAPVSIELVTAPRWLIVLAGSGGVLALAAIWMYFPAARRRWIAVGMAILVAGTAVAFPAQAILLGQATILGLALSAVSLWLQRSTGAPLPQTAPPHTGGSTNLRMRSSLRTDSYYSPDVATAARPPESHSTSSTPTAPLTVPDLDE
jgi:hypothetical protein